MITVITQITVITENEKWGRFYFRILKRTLENGDVSISSCGMRSELRTALMLVRRRTLFDPEAGISRDGRFGNRIGQRRSSGASGAVLTSSPRDAEGLRARQVPAGETIA